jgi:TRAP-type C4-dicarboxylate transport system permease small subunit
MGFPTYGNGPFTQAGIPTTVLLLVAFLAVCVGEPVMGWLLWQTRRSGTVLACALLPFELAFWVGFALPSGFVLGAARSVLVILGLLGRRRSMVDRPD